MTRLSSMLVLCLLTLSATARDVVIQGSGGGVNWTRGYIWADGYGVARADAPKRKQRLLARRAAQVDAYRNLAEFVNGVRVSSETVVQTMVLQSDTVRTKIDALVKGAVMVKDYYQNDIAQVTLRIYVDGPFSSTVNPATIGRAQTSFSLRHTRPVLWLKGLALSLNRFGIASANAMEDGGNLIHTSADLEFANRLIQRAGDQEPAQLLRQLQQDADSFRDSSSYTGLLIDATSVSAFELATIPRIRDPRGNVIYPQDALFSGSLAAKRPVSYDFDVQDAARNARIADHPYVIRAQSIYRSRKSDLVISESDARFIADNNQFREITRQAGVMIVVAE